jgi:hypothetical protein
MWAFIGILFNFSVAGFCAAIGICDWHDGNIGYAAMQVGLSIVNFGMGLFSTANYFANQIRDRQ